MLPNAFSFALLGAIESLLSAVVADGMTGRRHRSNTELIAQGIANVGSALFGGFCVTGTIARTATNVRAGAHGPVAGIAHRGFLLHLHAGGGAARRLRAARGARGGAGGGRLGHGREAGDPGAADASRGDAAVLLVTLGLTLFRGLAEAIVVGFALGAVLFINRMAQAVEVAEAPRAPYRPDEGADPEAVVYRIRGAMFFGAVSAVAAALDRIGDAHRVLVIDFAGVTLVDSSAANMIEGLAAKARRQGVAVYLTGAVAGAAAGAARARGAAAAGALRRDRRGRGSRRARRAGRAAARLRAIRPRRSAWR